VVTTARPIDSLVSLASAASSGEFICASSTGEIHVYLQRGRIAWATDSRHPFAFAAHLQETAGIDVDTFRQIVEECRREKLPLGETLVEWGLATWEVVRSALAHQIEAALSLLATTESGQTLFLARGYATYDEHLTFVIGDFIRPTAPIRRDPVPDLAPPPAEAPRPSASVAGRLRASIEGLSWVELYDDDRMVDGDPRSATPRVPASLIRATLLDGADFAAIRSTRTSVIGFAFARPRSVWCRVSAESTFGAVVASIWSIAGGTDKPADRPPPRPDATAWSLGEPDAASGEAVRSFLHRAQDVLGAVVLSADPSSPPVMGCGCSLLEPAQALDIARRRSSNFANGLMPMTDETERALDSIGFSLKTMVSGEPRLWCFGAELEREAGETLWLFLDRRNSQGLGWAYLAALTRSLARTRTGVA
jgi:hypothetical protein